MPRTLVSVNDVSNVRRGIIPGHSEQFNRYRDRIRNRQVSQSRVNRRSTRENNNDADDSSNSDHSLETDPDREVQKAVDRARTLSSELYLSLKEKHPMNLVYSPFGFCISTVLLKLACRGPSNDEIARALFLDEYAKGDVDEEERSSEMVVGLTALLQDLKEEPGKTFTFKHAYKLFFDGDEIQNEKPKLEFVNRVKSIYQGVEIEKINFSSDSWKKVSTTINTWVHKAGGNMLGEMVTKRTSNNKMIFVNPIYFSGNWIHPFNPAWTQEMKFFRNNTDFINVPMMKSAHLKNLLYAPINKLNCRALVLPYKGDRLGLAVFLPNDKAGLPVIESELESISPATYLEDMQKLRKKLSRTNFLVFLPSFRIDSTLDFQIPMKEMGIETIFNPGKADFSRIGANELSVTQILQKVVIDIDELGSEKCPKKFQDQQQDPEELLHSSMVAPAASTSGDVEAPMETVEFLVDHPFYFQLIDMKSDLILLSGSCTNPLLGKILGFEEFLEKYNIHVPPTSPTS